MFMTPLKIKKSTEISTLSELLRKILKFRNKKKIDPNDYKFNLNFS